MKALRSPLGITNVLNRRSLPVVTLVAMIAAFGIYDHGSGYFFTQATGYAVLQNFAIFGPVALGLGLTVIAREFDLSVATMFAFSGVIAVKIGGIHPTIGIPSALGVGLLAGLLQGVLIGKLRLGSMAVTLGGLLTFLGLGHVLTGSGSIPLGDFTAGARLDNPIAGIFSIRSLTALGLFGLAAIVMGYTRIGRDIYATGGDRRASRTAGVPVDSLLIGVFMVSGFATALAGSMLSYSLASASPTLEAPLVPAAAGMIIGGVSLAGGQGAPLGIAAGVLSLAVLRSGLVANAAPEYLSNLLYGITLLSFVMVDAPGLSRWWALVRRGVRPWSPTS